MVDLFNVPRGASDLAKRLAGWFARRRLSPASRTETRASDIAVAPCFREENLRVPPADDCLEFFAPDGTLIWEQRANIDS
jgi:hypothetical protein